MKTETIHFTFDAKTDVLSVTTKIITKLITAKVTILFVIPSSGMKIE